LNFAISTLAVFTVVLGFLVHNNFEKFVEIGNNISQCHCFNPVYLSISVSLVGLALAWIFYNTSVKAIKIPILYKLSYNKFYIDNFYDFIAEKTYYVFSKSCYLVDKYFIDGIVKLAAFSVRGCSWVFSRMQTGNFQSYLSYSLIFMAFIFSALMFAYAVIVAWGLISTY
jgi:NADH-quinone oxidoreductase subunit L